MHLYSGASTDFIRDSTHNLIAERLKDAFANHYRYSPSPSEVGAWKNSLSRMATAVELAGLFDHGVICEYQLPLTSRRLDVMLTGHNEAGRAMASIVELKQWDGARASEVEELVRVWVGGGEREVLHPSVQVGQYRQYLQDSHDAFAGGEIGIRSASYLHNFMFDSESELYAKRHANSLAASPLFAGDQVSELAKWLNGDLSGGGGVPLLDAVLNGRYRPNKNLLTHVAQMIRRESTYVLLDEQKVAFNAIHAGVAEAHRSGRKAVFLVKGGPGTGKSVLAVNLVAELSAVGYSTHHATGSRAFTGNLRRSVGTRASNLFKYFNSYSGEEEEILDVLIADEAHRIRQTSAYRFVKKSSPGDMPQVDELIEVARVSVFFIDDLQTVRPGEVGSSDLIRSASERAGATLKEYELEAQFRCGGSDSFVSWVENTLEIRRTADVIWDTDDSFEFDVVETPEELAAIVQTRASEGATARLVAGFCWPWSDPLPDGQLVDDVELGSFSMPWNAKPSTKTAKGIPKAEMWATDPNGRGQIGCVYTAQGFEFDYVGVIFGRDLVYRPRDGWVGHLQFSHDSVVKRSARDTVEAFRDLVKHTYRVLLSCGLRGCYVFFEDDQTRDYFLSRLERLRALGSRSN